MIRLNKKNTAYINITNEEASNLGSGFQIVATDPINPEPNSVWLLQEIIEKPLMAIIGGFPVNSTTDITNKMTLKVKTSTGEIFTTNLIKE